MDRNNAHGSSAEDTGVLKWEIVREFENPISWGLDVMRHHMMERMTTNLSMICLMLTYEQYIVGCTRCFLHMPWHVQDSYRPYNEFDSKTMCTSVLFHLARNDVSF